jgi:CHAP domain
MQIVETALKYIGQTEKPGNAGFNDAEFEAKMKAVGFDKGHAWCAYFCELVAKEARPEKFKEFDKLFSASAVKTFENFRDAAYPISELPHPGNLAVWQMIKDGKPQWQGHIGIVVSVQPNGWIFEAVEGNTNDQGGREGYIVAKRIRKTLKDVKEGLKIIGFVEI